MLVVFLALFVLSVLCSHEDVTVQKMRFEAFVKKYQRKYSTSEYTKRFEIFQENLKVISSMNKAGKGSAVFGVNQFADLSAEEFRAQYLMPKGDYCLT